MRTTFALKALRAVVLLALGLAAAVVPAIAEEPPRPLSISAHHGYLENSASADRLVEVLRLGIDNIEIELGKPDDRRGPSRTRVEARGSRAAALPAPSPSAPGRDASAPSITRGTFSPSRTSIAVQAPSGTAARTGSRGGDRAPRIAAAARRGRRPACSTGPPAGSARRQQALDRLWEDFRLGWANVNKNLRIGE